MLSLRIRRHLAGQVRHALVGGPPSDEDHNILTWYINSALVGVSDGGLWTFLPIYLARLGASATLLGLYSSLPALLSILVVIPAGTLMERAGDEMRGVVRVGLASRALILAMVLVPLFAPLPLVPVAMVALWVVRVIPDTAGNVLWTSIATRAVSPERRAHVNGTRWALLSGTSALCLILFGRWLDVARVPWAYEAVFMASLVASVFELGFFARLRVQRSAPEEETASHEGLRQRVAGYLQPLSEHGPFVRYLGATAGYRVALNMPAALFTLLWVRELGASNSLIGLRGTLTSAVFMLGYLFWGRRANRLGHRRLLAICALGGAAYAVASAFVPSAGWLLPVAVIWGLGGSGIDVALFDLMLDSCPPGKETRFASVANLTSNLAVFVGPLIGVALAGVTSVRAALVAAGLLQVAAMAAFGFLPRHV